MIEEKVSPYFVCDEIMTVHNTKAVRHRSGMRK